jgi:hypothetical protein
MYVSGQNGADLPKIQLAWFCYVGRCIGLLEALKPVGNERLPLKPVFILDPWFVKNARVGANRWRFLIQSLQASLLFSQ